ncbi:MAG: DUF1800 domain-containing protein [Acidobacteria bacterium]|nr:DUF1800 domain-containing protein [Acidobacteriota bacterium]
MAADLITKIYASALSLLLVLPSAALGFDTLKTSRTQLSADQKSLHLLNRITYGPRPADIERIRRIGTARFLEEQLNASAIDDTAAEKRVAGLEIFKMDNGEVLAKYPQPNALLRASGELNNFPQPNAAENGQTAADLRERREKLRKLYEENGLRLPARIQPQITANRVLRAAYSERQLQEVMVDFWQNHFNVFAGKGVVRWYLAGYERDVLRKHALGNFSEMLKATAKHPAMLFYLDNFQSVAPNNVQPRGAQGRLAEAVKNGTLTPQMRERIKRNQGITDAQLEERISRIRQTLKQAEQRPQRGLNENYARELMELHTLGVDGGYTQDDIVEVAKAFSGWTIADPRGTRKIAEIGEKVKTADGSMPERRVWQRRPAAQLPADSGEFYFNERQHHKGPIMLFGQKIQEGGERDGLKVLEILASHPSTAKFIARKLAVKFVNDTPKQELVDRVAAAFLSSKGDIKATLRTLFTDREFYATENYRAKIKTPFELAISSVRAVGAETNVGPQFISLLNKLGETPYGYQAPTGYPDTAEDWVNTGALLERMNFAIAISGNRIRGTRVNLSSYAGMSDSSLLDIAVVKLLGGEISPATKDSILRQMEQPLPEVSIPDGNDADEPMVRPMRTQQQRNVEPPKAFKVVSLVLGSPDFQRQ